MAEAIEPTKSWSDSLRALLHPRAIAMLFLGLSAGLPILLIFSSLSLWLSEAGLKKSAVTMFSWAALGYSFKFVWAPLIDRLPVPVLTGLLGRRRAWILTAQALIITAICWMAVTDPRTSLFCVDLNMMLELSEAFWGPDNLKFCVIPTEFNQFTNAPIGQWSLTAMALAAVLLGFSSATQDIVIDAYRIESADKDLQAMLSATYIAGYRIGMVIAGAGAIYLADIWGSSKVSYDFSAWSSAYFAMAAVMLIGVAATLLIREPEASDRSHIGTYPTSDYARFVLLFVLCVGGFIASFWLTSKGTAPFGTALTSLTETLREATGNKPLAGFVTETLRLIIGVIVAGVIGYIGMTIGVANKQMVSESYIDPVRDFFSRYGTSLALLLLALIGLYRISDIVLGVISNVFYQDIGFTKTEIAATVKTFGLLMTIAGGFLGGILAIRYGVMRILFAGAMLTVLTNLLFILLAETGRNMPLLYLVISADNLTAGLASAAFVAFLSSLTNVSFTAVQYAIFSSLMTLFPKIIGGYSGTIVESVGYSQFFLISSLLGVPVLLLIWIAGRRLQIKEAAES